MTDENAPWGRSGNRPVVGPGGRYIDFPCDDCWFYQRAKEKEERETMKAKFENFFAGLEEYLGVKVDVQISIHSQSNPEIHKYHREIVDRAAALFDKPAVKIGEQIRSPGHEYGPLWVSEVQANNTRVYVFMCQSPETASVPA